MHREGHIGTALVVYAPIGVLTMSLGFQQLAIIGGIGATALAMLPDIDQRVPGLRHRGPTHTIWFAGAAGGVASVLGALAGGGEGVLGALGLSVWAGVIAAITVGAHLFTDALTPTGIKPLAPVSDRFYSYDLTAASNPLANYALLALGVATCTAGLWVGTTIAGL